MALSDYILKYTKDWKNPADFPTYETKEEKVRADMQLLFDEMKNAFNAFLIDLTAGLLPFESSAAVPASNVQDAIQNVQQQVASLIIGELTIPQRSLTAEKLVEHTLTSVELGEGCVDSDALATGAVNTGSMADSAVTSAKIANGAVSGSKIADGGVGTTQLAANAVTSVKIKANAVSTLYTSVLATDAWIGSTAPYSQAVTIAGVLDNDVPIIDLIPSSDYATAVSEDGQWAQIYRAVADTDTITFYAKEKPTVALNFKARCIRK